MFHLISFHQLMSSLMALMRLLNLSRVKDLLIQNLLWKNSDSSCAKLFSHLGTGGKTEQKSLTHSSATHQYHQFCFRLLSKIYLQDFCETSQLSDNTHDYDNSGFFLFQCWFCACIMCDKLIEKRLLSTFYYLNVRIVPILSFLQQKV